MDPTAAHSEKICRNCGAPLPPQASFCSNCGQKNTDGRITLGQMFRELLENLFNLDSKIFRTLAALCVPGKLTTAYFQGKQKRYVPPIRIILLATIALIAAITFQASDDIQINGIADFKSKWYYHQFFEELQTTKEKTSQKFEAPEAQNALDSLLAGMKHHEQDSIELEGFLDFAEEKQVHIATRDLFEMPMDSIYYHYQIDGFYEQLLAKQKIRLLRNGDSFTQFLIGKISWMVLLTMPLLAFVLKLFYIRRKFYFVEHLVFCFHTHAFVFVGLILLLLFNQYLGSAFPAIVLTVLTFYLLFAFKRFYRQGWAKTIIKFLLIGVAYLFLLTFSTIATLIAGFFLF